MAKMEDLKLKVEVETVQVSGINDPLEINLDLLDAINKVCEKHNILGINPDDCVGIELSVGVNRLPRLTEIREILTRKNQTNKSTKESK